MRCTSALKDRYHGAPWYESPQPRFRDEQALAQAKQELCEEMAFHAFTQYVFEQQWMKLKRYANQRDRDHRRSAFPCGI
ncbi:MAG: 4-alpha-glucanotransferase [Merdibacter sp.]